MYARSLLQGDCYGSSERTPEQEVIKKELDNGVFKFKRLY